MAKINSFIIIIHYYDKYCWILTQYAWMSNSCPPPTPLPYIEDLICWDIYISDSKLKVPLRRVRRRKGA